VVTQKQYAALSNFRFHLAKFLRFSQRAARSAGIMPAQYLLLLHVRGAGDRDWMSVRELATRLQASPHGTAALVSRCVRAGLVTKNRSSEDERRVEVRLTPHGSQLVEQIAARHREELRSLREVFRVANIT
jgi:DNA-binding MarR family transcriptional regulator